MRVPRDQQAPGMASLMIAALLPIYRRLEIYRITIMAGLSAGAAVWAKFGFVPEFDEWARVGSAIRANVLDLKRIPIWPWARCPGSADGKAS